MSKTAVRIIVIVTAIVNMQFGILQYFLGTATYYYHYGMMNSTVHLTFILVGLTVAITSIPVVIFGIIRAKHTGQWLDFVFSIIALLLGIVAWHVKFFMFLMEMPPTLLLKKRS